MPKEFLETVYSKARGVLLEPDKFFKSAKKEKGLDAALKYLAAIALINSFFTSIDLSTRQGLTPFASTFIGLYLSILVALLLSAVVIQLFAIILGGDGSYNETFRALAYGYTPTALFGWAPVIGSLGVLYSLYLYVKGLSVIHKVSMWRAAAIVLLTTTALLTAVLMMLVVLIYAHGILGIGTGLGSMGSTQVANLI